MDWFSFSNQYARYDHSNVFNGSQLDDFMLAVDTSANSVLVLGSGPGAACLSLARAGGGRYDVIGVDGSARETALAGAFADYLGAPRVRFVHEEATDFLMRPGCGSFGVVIVDLYEDRDASPLNFDPRFWALVEKSLTDGGIVLVNVFGLPDHLDPMQPDSPGADVVSAMAAGTSWDAFVALPHLRNTTLIVGRAADVVALQGAPSRVPRQSEVDEFSDAARCLRFRCSPVQEVRPLGTNHLRRWTISEVQESYEERLNHVFSGGSDTISARQAVGALLDDECMARTFLDQELDLGNDEGRQSLIATWYHADRTTGCRDRLRWFPGWVCDNFASLSARGDGWLYRCAAWQVATAAASRGSLEEEDRLLRDLLRSRLACDQEGRK